VPEIPVLRLRVLARDMGGDTSDEFLVLHGNSDLIIIE
jgi:hypothetical protein